MCSINLENVSYSKRKKNLSPMLLLFFDLVRCYSCLDSPKHASKIFTLQLKSRILFFFFPKSMMQKLGGALVLFCLFLSFFSCFTSPQLVLSEGRAIR